MSLWYPLIRLVVSLTLMTIGVTNSGMSPFNWAGGEG